MPRRRRAREQARAERGTLAAEDLATSATTPPRGVGHVVTDDAAGALAHRLLDPSRTWPVVVLTTPAGRSTPYVDAAAVKSEVADLAEVVVLPTGNPSWAFSREMPDLTQVYGGASRVYGVELDWVDDPHLSRLHFAWSDDDDERVRRRLVHDALAAAMRAGLVGRAPSPAEERVAGRVSGVVGTRALVTLDDDRQATVAEELTVPGVALEHVLAPGQRVEGTFDPATRRLDISAALPDAAASRRAVAAAYRPGDVVLVRVREVERDAVTVELLPEARCRVARGLVTGNALDHLDDLFSVGEVVLGRTVAVPRGLSIRLDDVDDSEDVPVAAPALLPGGPPWLPPDAPGALREVRVPDVATTDVAEPVPSDAAEPVPPDAAVPVPSDAAGPARPAGPSPALLAARARGEPVSLQPPRDPTPVPTPAVAPAPEAPATAPRRGSALNDTQLALAAERASAGAARRESAEARARAHALEIEVTQLRELVQVLQGRLERRDRTIELQKTKYRNADKQRQLATRRGATDAERGPDFTDPVAQLRHDVYCTWARVVPAAEKSLRPLGPGVLGDYTVGPRFCDSLALEGISRTKVLETIVHVVTGRAAEIAGLQLHRLRSGAGGNAPPAVRDDGAECWRVSLQVNSPSARRLHFWRLPDGTVELSRVVLHDDMEP